MERLIVYSASIAAVVYLVTDTAYDQWFFVDTLLAVAFDFLLFFLGCKGFTYLDD